MADVWVMSDSGNDKPLDYRIDGARVMTGARVGGDMATELKAEDGGEVCVGVRDGKIVLGVDGNTPAERVIDGKGKVLCPGFIDIHSHSDFSLLYGPGAGSKLRTGYTSELNGNCGLGAFPLMGAMKEQVQGEYRVRGLDIDWETVEEYFERCAGTPAGVNQGLLLGHGALRGSVVGLENRAATRDEIKQMQKHTERAMAAGCVGFSTGLIYAPGSFADREEIVRIVEVVKDYGGVYASHLRSESDGLLEALDEFLGVCEETGCRGQYSHVKAAGRRNWGKMGQVRERMDAAKARGVSLYADRYPYVASCTELMVTLLPNDALGGGREAVVERLRDRAFRDEMKERVCAREQVSDLRAGSEGSEWFDCVMVAAVHEEGLKKAEGLTLAQWCRESGGDDVLEAAFDLLVEDGGMTKGIHFSMSEENLREILGWDDVMIGSDGAAHDGCGVAELNHPRSFGTPARILGQLTRDAGWLTLEQAVYKLTGQPAEVMGLRDRGLIRDGYAGDLVLFDAGEIKDCAEYVKPDVGPRGIEMVMVNGEVVVDNCNRVSNVLSGRLLLTRE